eukprot:ANDGO_01713.mRNA.1 Actin-related protein 2/3 complex subunit 1B
MSASASQLFQSISCFAFNGDKSLVAVCPNSPSVVIYATNGSKDPSEWTRETELSGQHDLLVTGIDWAPKTNRILTCAQDRNAYVWTLDAAKKTWTPTLVMLRTTRAATCCKWAPSEQKFAVGTAEKTALVCFYDTDNDWWVSKPIRKGIKSSVRSVSWHPNSLLLAVATTDAKCRVYNAQHDIPDQTIMAQSAKQFPKASALAATREYGEALFDFAAPTGWVHWCEFLNTTDDVAILAFVAHGSSLYVADLLEAANQTQSANGEMKGVVAVSSVFLPFTVCSWVSPTQIVCAGYDYAPVLFSLSGGKWEVTRKVEGKSDKAAPKEQTATRAAFERFQSQVNTGQAEPTTPKSASSSVHDNTIVGLASYASGKEFASCGLDGRVAVWAI